MTTTEPVTTHTAPRAPQLLGVEDVADRLGVSARNVRRLLKEDSLRAVRLGGRTLVREDDLARFVDGLPTTTSHD